MEHADDVCGVFLGLTLKYTCSVHPTSPIFIDMNFSTDQFTVIFVEFVPIRSLMIRRALCCEILFKYDYGPPVIL
jgi:hypothetical protein